METIKIYLENMFANMPKTDQILRIKNDLFSNMEEKYNELKNSGKSENEAIGIVISEFGNIDELVNELGIECDKNGAVIPNITQNEAENFITAKRESGILVGIGAALCIIAVAMLLLINTLVDNKIICKNITKNFTDMFGIIALVIIIIPAVALFIYSGMKLEKYEYLQNDFELTLSLKSLIQQKYDAFKPTYSISVIIGVCLCILSPIALFIGSAFGNSGSTYGLVVLLIIIAIAVFIFIYFGSINESFGILLKVDSISKEKAKNDKVIGAVAAIVWPLAACIFLISGLVFNQWHINWIVFPITGILFGMFCAVYSIIVEKK